MKLGAALFIVGFGWFVSYAFINNWIGPLGRISIGIVAGVLVMGLGYVIWYGAVRHLLAVEREVLRFLLLHERQGLILVVLTIELPDVAARLRVIVPEFLG